jgi:hypothetical protein
MKYSVVWTAPAEQELTSAWLNASDRNAVTSAAHEIDTLLSEDAERRGQARFDTVRTLVVPPLGVDFDVIEADRIVYVLTVWPIPPATVNGSTKR